LSIITFWGSVHGQVGTTSNVLALSSIIGMEYATRTLVSHTQHTRSTLEKSFEKDTRQNKQLIEMSDMGLDSLERLARNRKLTAESIKDSSLFVVKDRLDLLAGTEKNVGIGSIRDADAVAHVFASAKNYYDNILIDTHSGKNDAITNRILDMSDLLIVNLNQNINVLEEFFNGKDYMEIFDNKPTVVLLGQYDPASKYTVSKISRYFGKKLPIMAIPYNTDFRDACNDKSAMSFFKKNVEVKKGHQNYYFMAEVRKVARQILAMSGVSVDVKDLRNVPLLMRGGR